MVGIFGMTLEVISRPFYIELLQLRHFVAFLYLLFDIVSLYSLEVVFKNSLIELFLSPLRSLKAI